MTAESAYGPLRDEAELERVIELQSVAFNLSPEYCRQWSDDAGHDRLRAYRAGDAMVGCVGVHPFGQWIGGRCVPMAGIDGVGIDPAARGRGHSTALMAAVLREARERGLSISTLWPSTDVPYRRVGYAQAGVGLRWKVPLHELPADREAPRMRRFTEADRPAVEQAYRTWAARTNGQADREAFLWTKAFRRGARRAVGWLAEEGGAVVAFCTLHQKPTPAGSFDLDMLDFWFLSESGARALLAFCSAHRSLGEHLLCEAGPADPLWFWVTNQGRRLQRCAWWMVRVVDVGAALEARGWPAGLESEIHVRLRDEWLPENDGDFVLKLAGGAARVVPGGRGELAMDVAALAPLYTGHATASGLAARGWAEGPAPALHDADAAFAAPAPWMADGF